MINYQLTSNITQSVMSGPDKVTMTKTSKSIANISLAIVVICHVIGIVYFRSQPPSNTPEGMSTIGQMNALFLWYTFIVLMCLLSVFYRVKFISATSGKIRYFNTLIGVITLLPVFAYIYVIYENLT